MTSFALWNQTSTDPGGAGSRTDQVVATLYILFPETRLKFSHRASKLESVRPKPEDCSANHGSELCSGRHHGGCNPKL